MKTHGKNGIKSVINRINGNRVELWERINELLNNKTNDWGTGLIGIYVDSGYGEKGNSYNSSIGWSEVNYDFEKNYLSIRESYGSEMQRYNIYGWTGKYGMPMELLLSTHLATLMPDLSYDLATGFNTEVVILMHDYGNNGLYYKYVKESAKEGDEGTSEEGGSSEAEGGSSEEGTYIPIEDIETALNGTDEQKKQVNIFMSEEEMIRILGEEKAKNSPGIIISEELARRIIAAAGRAKGGGKFDTYISKVEDHWFRDVYFVLNDDSKDLLDFDEEYENKVRDRLTLYETYTINISKYGDSHLGEFILYELDDNGEFKKDTNGNYIRFEGTYDDAVKNNVKVSKKGKRINNNNSKLSSYGWDDSDLGTWSAYTIKDTGESMINAFANPSDEIEKRIYAKVFSGDKIAQNGDGLRTQTNAKIKNMFTNNEYFRYDGSTTTADVINELRKKSGISYGAINSLDPLYNQEFELSDGNKYKISEYAGKVSTNQDLLNIMSMLENIHTIDANYVYRDLRELSIDLGYYEKEELTDETPKLLEFIVPQIGSYGYPKRELDKTENEFGTMLHAKADFEAYETIREVVDETTKNKNTLDKATTQKTSNNINMANADTNINLSTNNFDRSNISLKNSVIQSMEEAYYAEGYDGSIDASPYDPSDPRYEGTQGSLYREYISIMKEKKENFYLANNLDEEEIKGNKITNSISLSSSLTSSVTAIQGQKRTLNAFDDWKGQIIVDDLEFSEWDDVLSTVLSLDNSINCNSIRKIYLPGDRSGYESWLGRLGGVFADYAGKDKKMGGETLEDFINANKYVYGLFSIVGFEYCAGGGSEAYRDGTFMEIYDGTRSMQPYDNRGKAGEGSHTDHIGPILIDDCMEQHMFLTNCNYTTDKVYHKAGLFGGEGQPDSSCAYISLIENFGAQVVFDPAELKIGDLIECFENNNGCDPNPHSWSGWTHVMFVYDITDEELVFHTTGHDYTAAGHFVLKVPFDQLHRGGNWYPDNTHPGWVGLHLYDFESSGLYEGYNGNEAVVSPVTGVLLEYGTYDDEKIDLDGKVKEEYRVNTDLQYDSNHTENKDLGIGEMTVHDKVGYAKILVLDADNYQKLESYTNNKWRNDSLITYNNKENTYRYEEKLLDKDSEKKLSQLNKTVYGYKEFVEAYDKYGISGYVIYIDGFACELPRQEIKRWYC